MTSCARPKRVCHISSVRGATLLSRPMRSDRSINRPSWAYASERAEDAPVSPVRH